MSEKVFIFLFYTFNLSHYYEPSLALVICLIIIAQHECEPKIEEAFKNSLSAVMCTKHIPQKVNVAIILCLVTHLCLIFLSNSPPKIIGKMLERYLRINSNKTENKNGKNHIF